MKMKQYNKILNRMAEKAKASNVDIRAPKLTTPSPSPYLKEKPTMSFNTQKEACGEHSY